MVHIQSTGCPPSTPPLSFSARVRISFWKGSTLTLKLSIGEMDLGMCWAKMQYNTQRKKNQNREKLEIKGCLRMYVEIKGCLCMYVERICCINCRGCFCVVIRTYLEYVGDIWDVCVGEHTCCGEKRETTRRHKLQGLFCVVLCSKVSGVCGGHGMYVGERAICGEREREREREELAGGRYLNQPQTIIPSSLGRW